MKKIMFDDRFDLTQAVLDGRKTMTRRTISEKALSDANDYVQKVHGTGHDFLDYLLENSPYKVGEVVAVAQRYSDIMDESVRNNYIPKWSFADEHCDEAGWKNKMFVRADLMPHQIRITSVRIERLQDISDEDCLREGVRKLESENCPAMFTFDGWSFKNKVNRCTDSPKEAFEALFKKLSGKKAWDDNPWVFVYEFELIK